jgi:hypothetical protein
MNRGLSIAIWAAIGLLAIASPARAQQRPLTVEDPETIGAGRMLAEVGFGREPSAEFPLYGLEGDLLRVPEVGLSFGLGSVAELQLDSGFNRLTDTRRSPAPLTPVLDFTGDTTSAVDDVVVATKIRIVSEQAGRPGIGVRFATKLPNASNETGLGTDMTDFAMTALVGKTTGSVRVVGNVGFAILGDPTQLAVQHDPLLYGVSIAGALAPGFEVVGELAGRWLAQGDEPAAEDHAALRAGLRYTYKTVRVDGAAIMGLTDQDPSLGFTVGVTWVFDAFGAP